MRLPALLTFFLCSTWAAMAETITIDAAKLEVQQQENRATFSGNVVVKQPGFQLKCQQLVGQLEQGQLDKLTATGGVVITRQQGNVAETATGDNAVYYPNRQQLVMTGHVTLTHGPNTLVGNRLEYDIKAGKANLTGNSGVSGQFSGSNP